MRTAEFQRLISIDIETAGPNPGDYALLTIGACRVADPQQGFYAELKPDRDRLTPEAFGVHGLSLDALHERGLPPLEAIRKFDAWLSHAVPNGEAPIFAAFNAPFDWMFIAEYFHRYLGRNPFGHAALDIKALYMGASRTAWGETSMEQVASRYLDGQALSHHALEDAKNQAKILRAILKQLDQGE